MTILTSNDTADYGVRHNPELVYLDISLIRPSGVNPRKRFDPDALQDLADSIRIQGVLEPILVRDAGDYYSVMAGERRLRAAKLAELSEIPAIVRHCTEEEAVEIALVENLLRLDLNAIEEAEGYQRLSDLGMTQEKIASRVRRTQSTIAHALRLLKLPEDVREQICDGLLTPSHGKALCSLSDHPDQVRHYTRLTIEQDWTTTRLEKEISAFLQSQREQRQPRLTDPAPGAVDAFMAAPGARPPAQAEMTESGDVREPDVADPSHADEADANGRLLLADLKAGDMFVDRNANSYLVTDVSVLQCTSDSLGADGKRLEKITWNQAMLDASQCRVYGWRDPDQDTAPPIAMSTKPETTEEEKAAAFEQETAANAISDQRASSEAKTPTPPTAPIAPSTPAAASAPAQNTAFGAMTQCFIPAEMDDWLWGAGFQNITEALELLRRLETVAQLQNLTLQAYVAQQEERS